MFEDSFLRRRVEGRKRLITVLPLLVSVVLHGLIVYGLFHARMTIKMLALASTVRNVTIVPPFKLSVPRIVGRPPTKKAADETPRAGPAPAGTGGGVRRRKAAEAAPPNPAPGAPAGPGAQASALPSLSSKFQQSMASRYKTEQQSEFSIVLGPPGSKGGPSGTGAKGPPVDFYQYIPATVAGRGGFGTGAARGGQGQGGGPSAGISIPLKGYNLAPWAQQVLELIQKNWNLPPVGNYPERFQVKIILFIRKSGDVSSVELVVGTPLDILDQAALNAVRTSLPFPPLPADFPGDFLEASITFTYHD